MMLTIIAMTAGQTTSYQNIMSKKEDTRPGLEEPGAGRMPDIGR
ncbi:MULTISPECIES: hypothetical protein [Asaia]|nr:hypothetical protein [Asaia spathodeae]GBR20361.1 hypothetical protein AA105894_2541 [Asaia spathodeae NBRC 105894]